MFVILWILYRSFRRLLRLISTLWDCPVLAIAHFVYYVPPSFSAAFSKIGYSDGFPSFSLFWLQNLNKVLGKDLKRAAYRVLIIIILYFYNILLKLSYEIIQLKILFLSPQTPPWKIAYPPTQIMYLIFHL